MSSVPNRDTCGTMSPYSLTSGVTLIELLVTLSILTILMTIAVPSFSDFITGNRIVSNTNDFMATLNLARSEAIKRGTFVTVCRIGSADTCATDTGNNWSNGWMVFVDSDNDGTFDSNVATEEILRRHEALTSTYTLISNSSNLGKHITFDHTGAIDNAGAAGASFYLCANNQANSLSRSITLTRTKLRVVKSTNQCS